MDVLAKEMIVRVMRYLKIIDLHQDEVEETILMIDDLASNIDGNTKRENIDKLQEFAMEQELSENIHTNMDTSKLDFGQILNEEGLLVADPPDKPARGNKFEPPPYKYPRELIEDLRHGPEVNKRPTRDVSQENYVEVVKEALDYEEAHRITKISRFNENRVKLYLSGKLLRMNISNLHKERPPLKRGDEVAIKCETKRLSCSCYVHTVRKSDILIQVHKKLLAENLEELTFQVRFQPSTTSMRLCYYSVSQYDENKKLDLPGILFPKKQKSKIADVNNVAISIDRVQSIETRQQICGCCPTDKKVEDFPELECFNRQLNFYQRRAVVKALEHVARPCPYLIWGPAGTGKTSTICEIIRQVHSRTKGSKILVCANSTTGTRIINAELARFSGSYRTNEQKAKDLQAVYNKLYALEGPNKCQVVITTCIQAGLLHGFKDRYDYVMIDEAGRASEPESLIPITLLKPGGSVILAGDFKQLGPASSLPPNEKTIANTSLFERISSMAPYRSWHMKGKLAYDDRFISMLLINYRSDRRVMAINNELFYHNKLKFPFEVPERFKNILNFEKLTVMHNTSGPENRLKKRCGAPSWFNNKEIINCASYVEKLYKFGIKPDELGVVTIYRQQVNELTRLLFEHYNLPECKIGTVEDFQGDEREVIIISTVASHKKLDQDWRLRQRKEKQNNERRNNNGRQQETGQQFVFDPRRFNVATSRARWLTIVVGDAIMLRTDPCWRKFIENSQRIGMGERFEKAEAAYQARMARLAASMASTEQKP